MTSWLSSRTVMLLALAVSTALAGCSGARVKKSTPFYERLCLPESGKGPNLPAIDSLSPTEGSQPGGSLVTVKGEGFVEGAQVFLGKATCTGVSVIDPHTITCLSSEYSGTRLGKPIDLVVMNPDRRCGVLVKAFTYIPTVSIQPRGETIAVGNTMTFSAVNGKPPFVYSLVSGGGSVNASTGEYRAPDQPGNAVVRVTDAIGTQSEGVVAINPALEVVAGAAAVAAEWHFQFAVTGGVPPVSYSVKSGEGTIDSATGLYQAPPNAGDAVVQAQDSLGNVAEAPIKINPKLEFIPKNPSITPKSRVTATGGAAPYHFTIISGQGSIEPGDSAYIAPDSPGTAVVRVTDSSGSYADTSLVITNTVYLHPPSPNVVLGDRILFTATGGTLPYTYSLVSGKGTIDSVSGIYVAPDTPGQDVIRATDSSGGTGETTVTITDQGLIVQQITSGSGHTCALISGGVKCWGDNRHGQLGDGTLISSTLPVWVEGLRKGVSSISAGQNHTCAVVSGGEIRCWGDNRYGQLGNNSMTTAASPVSVFGISHGAQAISAGENHTCAIINGAALCWGNNRRGQLGNNSTTQSLIPVQVSGLVSHVQSISSGAAHTCALVDGGVKCWGYNYAGQLGNGNFSDRLTAVPVKGLEQDVEQLDVGGFHSCVATKTGVKCWGYNGGGQLGNGSQVNQSTPVAVNGLESEVLSLSAGYYHSCVVMLGGNEVKCWGYNHYGQLGDDSTRMRTTPVSVHALPAEVKGITAGVNHTCALQSDGVRCWGDNSHGQFGNHSTVDSHFPTALVPLRDEKTSE